MLKSVEISGHSRMVEEVVSRSRTGPSSRCANKKLGAGQHR